MARDVHVRAEGLDRVPDAALLESLIGIAEARGLDFYEAAKGGPGDRQHDSDDFPEQYLRDLWGRLEAEHTGWINRALDDLEGMMQRGEIDFPLDVERGQDELVAHRLAIHAAGLLYQHGVRDYRVREALARDILGRAPWVVDLIGAGYRLGLVHQAVKPEVEWDRAWSVAQRAPLTDVDRFMLAHVKARGGAYLRKVAYTASEAGNLALLERDVKITRDQMLRGIEERIHPHRLAGFMADLTGRKVDRGDGVMIWSGGDWSRDWRRVARTELAFAHNHGALSAMLQRHPENADRKDGDPLRVPRVLVFKQPQRVRRREGKLWAPCTHCYRIWYADDTTPQLYPLDDVIAAGENVGKKAAEWGPTVGPTHPNDLCGPLREFIPETLNLYPGMRKQLDRFRGKGFDAVEEVLAR